MVLQLPRSSFQSFDIPLRQDLRVLPLLRAASIHFRFPPLCEHMLGLCKLAVELSKRLMVECKLGIVIAVLFV
jgi:hypothetical protein